MSHKNFSGKFGENQAKFFRTPKSLPAHTPVVNTSIFIRFIRSVGYSGILYLVLNVTKTIKIFLHISAL